MRLRRLVALSLAFALASASPALAQEPPPGAETTAPPQAEPSAPPPQPEGSPPPETEGADRPVTEKLEPGLDRATAPERAIVELRGPEQAAPVAERAEELPGADVVLRPEDTSFIVVQGDGASLSELAEDPRVVAVRRDRAYPPALASSVKTIGADLAHASGVTGAGQTIAIMDTGIDRDHPALAGRIVAEACFSATDEAGLRLESLCPNGQSSQIGPGAADAETPKCLDGAVNLCDHGTHVAGIAAGAAVDGAPGAGVAPGADIIAVQIFSRVNDPELCGEPTCLLAFDSTLRLGLEHIATLTGAHRIAAVNLSVGGGLSDVPCDALEEGDGLKPSIDALLARGVPTVVAAGNEAFQGADFPGCISTAVTVGATDDTDAIAWFSNRGPLLDFFAPGVEVDSAVPGGTYAGYSGTSMATPHVAGALALLREKMPDAPVDTLLQRLRESGRPIVYGDVTTPRIDVNAALTGAAPSPPVTQEPLPDVPDTPEDPDEPTPTPTTAPTPEPRPTDEPLPAPKPLPAVTVTVTVTVTPSPVRDDAAVCTRGSSRKALTAARWAREFGGDGGTLPDATLKCYLSLVKKASKIFPEITEASTPASAAKVLKGGKSRKARLDRELLAAWLNWAHGARNITAKVDGRTTLRQILTAAERQRLDRRPTAAEIDRSIKRLQRHVNK
ncbi:Serine protease, subtilisin family [Thermostaphylospora chromogena]|uniref:Serine protease, subtilisin family n=1 Tax=Thermostaphylospora chromogena TaxID=35622 RepID=A0A1H1AJA7_9ACTN|nr:Serine protease, subtilisin family [Thermostaphylospora chromogena]